MFNFTVKSDEVSLSYASASLNATQPNWRGFFGDWYVLATAN